MIAVIDYGRGNLFSLSQALQHLNTCYQVTNDPEDVARATQIILPGVGAFGDGMRELNRSGLVIPIQDAARRGVWILGICLGMQFLVDSSEEFGDHKGLGLIPGRTRKLSTNGFSRVPNVGWRWLHPKGNNFLSDLAPKTMAYFVHSFAVQTDFKESVLANIKFNDEDIPAVIRRDNVIGYQFHPEKSGPAGLELIQRFLRCSCEG
ncbi:MAG: imidazole glycerol phosphate synthase subunit HisH [Gammaproteobacteria bacterium]|nr:imidazole glycerol phosphate synthase subunit HisH [Gammaproteobacteria bacterium]